jgi:pyruvate dehydrogenase E2 component (dihydrolipoamide acetyltransferase)
MAVPGHESRQVQVPDIGDFHDVPVIEWLVQVGDAVAKDQGLLTLESDKATLEVPAPFAGVLRAQLVPVGARVSEGTPIAELEVDAAATQATAAPAAAAVAAVPPPAPAAAPAAATKASAPAAPAPTAATATAGPPSAPPVAFDLGAVLPSRVPYASPAVRLYARELGVDLSRVKGSARGGRITRDDVRGFVKQVMSGAAPARGGLDLLPWPKVDFARFGPIEIKPLSRIQKLSGANLARNWAMIPHVTQHDLADITDLEALRAELNAEHAKDGLKLTPLTFLLKAVAATLRQFPQFNASLDETGEHLVMKQYVHVGFAADTPQGLVVPVIRDVDKKGVLDLAAESAALAAKARDGKLSPAEMQGGCFSISSLGGIGGTAFTPIVNAPEVAILGVSKASMQPHWDGKAFQPRLLLPLSLSYDHRVIDGAAAARFTRHLAALLADMRRALL